MVWNIFYFHPYLGMISNLTNIFQMGWNHQLDLFHPYFEGWIKYNLHFSMVFLWAPKVFVCWKFYSDKKDGSRGWGIIEKHAPTKTNGWNPNIGGLYIDVIIIFPDSQEGMFRFYVSFSGVYFILQYCGAKRNKNKVNLLDPRIRTSNMFCAI